MSDIAMCEGGCCPVKDKCHRFTEKPDELRQSYFRKPPFEIIHNKFTCAFFWEESADLLFEQLTGIIKDVKTNKTKVDGGRKKDKRKSGRK